MPFPCKIFVAIIFAIILSYWYFCSDYAGTQINNGIDGEHGSVSCGYCVTIEVVNPHPDLDYYLVVD